MPLKNLIQQPPKGWSFQDKRFREQPFIAGTFESLCRFVQKMRLANPNVTSKYQLPTNLEAIRREVENYTCLRALNEGWYDGFCYGPPPLETTTPFQGCPPQLRQKLDDVVAGARAVKIGVSTYLKWVGAGGRPVSREKSAARAQICVTCPNNQDRGSMLDYFTQPVAEQIMKWFGIMQNLEISTPFDDKLHICVKCSCPLRAKAHVPIQHIKSEMDPKVLGELPDFCWIRKEANGA